MPKHNEVIDLREDANTTIFTGPAQFIIVFLICTHKHSGNCSSHHSSKKLSFTAEAHYKITTGVITTYRGQLTMVCPN